MHICGVCCYSRGVRQLSFCGSLSRPITCCHAQGPNASDLFVGDECGVFALSSRAVYSYCCRIRRVRNAFNLIVVSTVLSRAGIGDQQD